jgi:hypothetical protein
MREEEQLRWYRSVGSTRTGRPGIVLVVAANNEEDVLFLRLFNADGDMFTPIHLLNHQSCLVTKIVIEHYQGQDGKMGKARQRGVPQ